MRVVHILEVWDFIRRLTFDLRFGDGRLPDHAEEEAAQEEVASCELTGKQSRDSGRPCRSLVL